MKKLLLLALTAMIMVGCVEKNPDGSIKVKADGNNPRCYVIDSCEYVKWSYSFDHKGNCKFCKERRRKEIIELIDSLFNMQD